MDWSRGRRKPRIANWLHVCLTVCLLVSLAEVGQAQQSPHHESGRSEPRKVLPFDSDWRFHRADSADAANLKFADSDWDRVRLPHTYNQKDAVPGQQFYAGPAWYRKSFRPNAAWKDGRVFIRFGAASQVAEVYVNGDRLGEHRGGFSAFAFELTSHLRYGSDNVIAVRVDNGPHPDVSPLSGDFTIFGGLYRSVSLLVTGPIAITPLDYASPGVFLKQSSVSSKFAKVELTTKITNALPTSHRVQVRVQIIDREGHRITSSTAEQPIAGSATTNVVQTFILRNPHLWDGTRDPYLYSARVELISEGRIIDSLDQPLGLRHFEVDPKRGFVLNGIPRQIHGVCMHQDTGESGWASSDAETLRDMSLIRKMGATGIRLAHYQHGETTHVLADKSGMLVWAELAQVNNVGRSPEYLENVRQQLRELIRQNFNHPSIVMWSLHNELGSQTKDISPALIRELNQLAHEEDPTRPTTGAASGDTINNVQDVVRAVDLVAANIYTGWYVGRPEDMGSELDRWNRHYGSRGIAVSEYGAGASVHQHEQGRTERPTQPNGRFHPEEWQAIVHEKTYKEISARPEVWGSFVWVMFDFASVGRHEGDTDGINDKGLVTRDRRIKKDAYYFYKANWSAEPFVYLASRRDDHRSAGITDVKVYSNAPQVSLRVNGSELGTVPADEMHVFRWKDIRLRIGRNILEVEAKSNGQKLTDSVVWLVGEPVGAPPSQSGPSL